MSCPWPLSPLDCVSYGLFEQEKENDHEDRLRVHLADAVLPEVRAVNVTYCAKRERVS